MEKLNVRDIPVFQFPFQRRNNNHAPHNANLFAFFPPFTKNRERHASILGPSDEGNCLLHAHSLSNNIINLDDTVSRSYPRHFCRCSFQGGYYLKLLLPNSNLHANSLKRSFQISKKLQVIAPLE